MPKRFIDTEIWKKGWFRKLEPTIKLFIIYLFTNCDHAGLLDVDVEAAEFHINGKIDLAQVPEGWFIEVSKDKWFIPKFLNFQYPRGLNQNMKMHQSVAKLLEKYNLNNYLNTQKKPTPSIRGKVPLQDKDKDKEKEKEVETKKKEMEKQLNLIMKYFDFNTKDNSDKFTIAKQFLLELQQIKKFKYFVAQFNAYKKYKNATAEIRHGFNSFLGTQHNHLKGGWNNENWSEKLKRLKKTVPTTLQAHTIDQNIKNNPDKLKF